MKKTKFRKLRVVIDDFTIFECYQVRLSIRIKNPKLLPRIVFKYFCTTRIETLNYIIKQLREVLGRNQDKFLVHKKPFQILE